MSRIPVADQIGPEAREWIKNNLSGLKAEYEAMIAFVKTPGFDINRAPCVFHTSVIAAKLEIEIKADLVYNFGNCSLCKLDEMTRLPFPPYDGPPEDFGASLVIRSSAFHIHKTSRPIFNTAGLIQAEPKYTDMFIIQDGHRYIVPPEHMTSLMSRVRRSCSKN